jgi:hypothetical protein
MSSISGVFKGIIFKAEQQCRYPMLFLLECSPEINRFRAVLRDRHQAFLDVIPYTLIPFSTSGNVITQLLSSG